MPNAIVNLRLTPLRMLLPSEAAKYCGMALKHFESSANIAPVKMPDGKIRYDIRDLDQWIDAVKGDDVPDDDILGKLR